MVRQLYAAEPETPVLLATLDTDELDEPIRATTHDGRLSGTATRGIESRGDTFIFTPFNFAWPGASADQPIKDAQFEMFNRSGEVTEAIRLATGNPTLTVEMVRASAPDTVELAMANAAISEAEIDDPKVTATIKAKRFDTEPACKASAVPSRLPGLF